MTTEELEKLLAEQPVSRLHRLARGRLHRHFRYGKRRLVEALLRASTANPGGLISDLEILMEEGRQSPTTEQKQPRAIEQTGRAGHSGRPAVSRRPTGAPLEAEPHEPATDLAGFLEGIGVPQAQPFHPDAWQLEALSHL